MAMGTKITGKVTGKAFRTLANFTVGTVTLAPDVGPSIGVSLQKMFGDWDPTLWFDTVNPYALGDVNPQLRWKWCHAIYQKALSATGNKMLLNDLHPNFVWGINLIA